MRILLSLVVLAFLLPRVCNAADVPGKPKPRCEVMDYGPFLTATWGEGKDNFALKGVAVRVSKEPQAHVVFDTELLRISAAWTGDYTDFHGLPFIGGWKIARGPNVKGDVQFSTRATPGWAGANGAFADPRSVAEGPLPKEWWKYRGQYVHGDKVIFSYSVGDCSILDLPGYETAADGTSYFSRTLNLSASTNALSLSIADDKAFGKVVKRDGVYSIAIGDHVLAATCAGDVSGVAWGADERVSLRIPAHAKPIALKICMARFSNDTDAVKLAVAQKSAVEQLEPLTHGGPLHWEAQVETKGVVAKDESAYVVDTLTAPDDNPWHSWLRFGALDFFSDGRAALTTWSGDVWIVSGIDAKLDKLVWKRFATGLFQPLGLRIVHDEIVVLAHGQIIKLHDLNHDGEADFYENFNSDCAVTSNYHEFANCLETDAQGNFYFQKGAPALAGRQDFERYSAQSGCLVKVAYDGSKIENIASGFRESNGLCISPDGDIFTTDNQGNWMPECPLSLIQKGGFYGMVNPNSKEQPPPRAPSLLWFPYTIDKSSATPVWESSDAWGPAKGQMAMTSYGMCNLFHIMLDRVDGKIQQAAAVRFQNVAFLSGAMRARFSPKDGQLYVCGLKGWGTAAAKDSCFQRVRYTGKAANMPVEFQLIKGGVRIVFSDKLTAESASDVGNASAEMFNVVATKEYGSAEYWVNNPAKKGREPLEIKAAKLLPDGKTLELKVDGMKLTTNLVVKCKYTFADGAKVGHEIDGSINVLP